MVLKKYRLDTVAGADNLTFFFRAPDEHYQGAIAAACGVTQLADNDPLADMPLTKTEELTGSPVAVRKTLRLNAGNGVKKYSSIVVAADKAPTIDQDLVGVRHKLGVIERVLDPRKATRY